MMFRRSRPEAVAAPPAYSPAVLGTLHAQTPCAHCGGLHAISCPRVRRLRFHASGAIEEVEFWATWSVERVIWKEDLPALPAAGDG